MIEDYKSKNLTLKKSLAAATLAAANSAVHSVATPIAPPTPAPITTIVETVAPSSGKKRNRPVEADPNPTAPLPPRAIVVKISPVPAKENIATEKPVSAKSYSKSSSRDELVALKPPAPTPVKRTPLSTTSINGISTTVLGSALSAPIPAKGAGTLRERLEAMRAAGGVVRRPTE